MDKFLERKLRAYVEVDERRIEAVAEEKTARKPCYYCAAEVHAIDCPSRGGGEETET